MLLCLTTFNLKIDDIYININVLIIHKSIQFYLSFFLKKTPPMYHNYMRQWIKTMKIRLQYMITIWNMKIGRKIQKLSKNYPKIIPHFSKNDTKMMQKWSKLDPKFIPNWSQMDPTNWTHSDCKLPGPLRGQAPGPSRGQAPQGTGPPRGQAPQGAGPPKGPRPQGDLLNKTPFLQDIRHPLRSWQPAHSSCIARLRVRT